MPFPASKYVRSALWNKAGPPSSEGSKPYCFSKNTRSWAWGTMTRNPRSAWAGISVRTANRSAFLKIAFGIVLSGKPDPHGLCGVIPFGCGGAFKGADGVPGFLGKNGEAEEPLFLRLGARFPSAAVDPFVHPLTRAAASPGLRYGGGMWPIRNHAFRTGRACHTERQARGFAGEGCFMRLHWAALRLLVEDARKAERKAEKNGESGLRGKAIRKLGRGGNARAR